MSTLSFALAAPPRAGHAFLRHLELILTVAGVVVVGVTLLLFRERADAPVLTGMVATAVGVLHGLIFWVVRRRQRHVREATVSELRAMLKDVTNNHLTVILAHAMELEAAAPTSRETEESRQEVEQAVMRISAALNSLSEESLSHWHARYDGVMPMPGRVRV